MDWPQLEIEIRHAETSSHISNGANEIGLSIKAFELLEAAVKSFSKLMLSSLNISTDWDNHSREACHTIKNITRSLFARHASMLCILKLHQYNVDSARNGSQIFKTNTMSIMCKIHWYTQRDWTTPPHTHTKTLKSVQVTSSYDRVCFSALLENYR